MIFWHQNEPVNERADVASPLLDRLSPLKHHHLDACLSENQGCKQPRGTTPDDSHLVQRGQSVMQPMRERLAS